MKPGDKIIAIDEFVIPSTNKSSLTIGKKYVVDNIIAGHFYIINDNSSEQGFPFTLLDKYFKMIENSKNSLLLQADKVVNGDRNEQYGDAKQAFNEYSDILKTTFNISLSPEEICKVMMAIKLGRLKYKFKEDSLLDLMGYSEILNKLQT
jgi:hypothetical protein